MPGEGTIEVVVTAEGQGISLITITDLVTPCGTFNQQQSFAPALDIQEPGFFTTSLNASEASLGLDLSGFFSEDGTIRADVHLFSQSGRCDHESNLTVTLRRLPPPSDDVDLPDAGVGPAEAGGGLNWLVSGLAGAGLAWLAAGLAGAAYGTMGGSGLIRAGWTLRRRVAVAEPSPAPAEPAGPRWVAQARESLAELGVAQMPRYRALRDRAGEQRESAGKS